MEDVINSQQSEESFNEYIENVRSNMELTPFGEVEPSFFAFPIILGVEGSELQQELIRTHITFNEIISCCKNWETDGNSQLAIWENEQRPEEGTQSNCGIEQGHRFEKWGMTNISKECTSYNKEEDFTVVSESNITVPVDVPDESVKLETIRAKKEAWTIVLKISNVFVKFQLDSGATGNTLNAEVFNKIIPRPKLKSTHVKLQAYGGFIIEPLGECILSVSNRRSTIAARFVVIQSESCKPVLGLRTCLDLDIFRLGDPSDGRKDKHAFIHANFDVFEEVGCFPDTYTITTKPNAQPVREGTDIWYVTASRNLRQRERRAVKQLQSLDIITPLNDDDPPEWISEFVVLAEDDGSFGYYLDPRHLNAVITLENFYSTPTLSDIEEKLRHRKYYTVFEIKDGFQHIKLDEESSRMCTFSTYLGYYSFKRLPFGVKSGLEVYHQLDSCFGDIEEVIVYSENVIIASKTEENHAAAIDEVLSRARKSNIKFNKHNFKYFESNMEYLGMLFNERRVAIDRGRIEGIKDLKTPENKNELMEQLSFINYVRDFIPNFDELIEPLKKLLRNDTEWSWTSQYQEILDRLKDLVCMPPLLKNFSCNSHTTIIIGTTENVVRFCLKQKKGPILYESRPLSDATDGFTRTEKELMALYCACEACHNYIYGRKVTIQTEHKPLISMMSEKIKSFKNNTLKSLRVKLMQYDLKIEYVPRTNLYDTDSTFGNEVFTVEDDISMDSEECTFDYDTLYNIRAVKQETLEDAELATVIKFYHEGWPKSKRMLHGELAHFFKVKDYIRVEKNLLFYNGRLVIPKSLRAIYLEMIHEEHRGLKETVEYIESSIYWPGILTEIRELLLNCDVCNHSSNSDEKESTETNQQKAKYPFQIVTVDITEFENDIYLVILDSFSRWIEVIKMADRDSDTVIKILKEIFCKYGIPEIVFADDIPFHTVEFKEFAQEWKFDVITCTPLSDESNDSAESGVDIALRLLNRSKETGIDISIMLLKYRSQPQVGLKTSPGQLLMGRPLRNEIHENNSRHESKAAKNDEAYKKYQGKKYLKKDNHKNGREYIENENVWVQNIFSKTWEKGIVIQKLEHPNSYLVKMENNKELRRNSSFIKRRKSGNMEKEENTSDNKSDVYMWEKISDESNSENDEEKGSDTKDSEVTREESSDDNDSVYIWEEGPDDKNSENTGRKRRKYLEGC